MRPLLEICCGDIESVRAAVAGGADRIELCCALSEGGLTPSFGLLRKAIGFGIPVNVLIRPRRGDFLYSEEEVDVMVEDIRQAVACGANGVVIGALDRDGNVDMSAVKRMVEAAGGVYMTFHRAFDLCRDTETALERIVEAGCDTLLTSGMRQDALSGAENIREIRKKAAGRLQIMAGSGVNPGNVRKILEISGADAIHGTASAKIGSGMLFRREDVSMGNPEDEYTRKVTDVDTVRQLRAAIDLL